jgi:hypothetical protein
MPEWYKNYSINTLVVGTQGVVHPQRTVCMKGSSGRIYKKIYLVYIDDDDDYDDD